MLTLPSLLSLGAAGWAGGAPSQACWQRHLLRPCQTRPLLCLQCDCGPFSRVFGAVPQGPPPVSRLAGAVGPVLGFLGPLLPLGLRVELGSRPAPPALGLCPRPQPHAPSPCGAQSSNCRSISGAVCVSSASRGQQKITQQNVILKQQCLLFFLELYKRIKKEKEPETRQGALPAQGLWLALAGRRPVWTLYLLLRVGHRGPRPQGP